MSEFQYLPEIGKRGGLDQPPRTDQVACATNGCDPRGEARRFEGGKALALRAIANY